MQETSLTNIRRAISDMRFLRATEQLSSECDGKDERDDLKRLVAMYDNAIQCLEAMAAKWRDDDSPQSETTFGVCVRCQP